MELNWDRKWKKRINNNKREITHSLKVPNPTPFYSILLTTNYPIGHRYQVFKESKKVIDSFQTFNPHKGFNPHRFLLA